MKKYRLITALLCLILLACLSCVEGQQYIEYSAGSASYTTPSPTSVGQTTPLTSQKGQTANQYSKYYTTGPALNAHITTPQHSIYLVILQLLFSSAMSGSPWLILNINPLQAEETLCGLKDQIVGHNMQKSHRVLPYRF